MKVAVVAEFFFPAIGGQEQRLLDIVNEMVLQGNEIDVYTIQYDENLALKETYNEINIYRILTDFTYRSGGGVKSRSIKTILQFSIVAAMQIKKSNKIYDKIIYTQFPIFHIMFAKCIGISGLKILDFVEYRENFFWRNIFRLEIYCADRVVCISEQVRKKVVNIGSVSKLVTIPSSIPIEKFYKGNAKYFLFVGRMEAHKHPENAIKTVMEYNRKYCKTYELHLIGNGSLYDKLVYKYKNNINIVFHGFVEEKEKIAIMSDAIALIFPSEREGLPVSVIEAMACGVPTLTTDYPNNGTKDFVRDEKIGLVAEPQISSLVSMLAQLLLERDLWSVRCIETIHKYRADMAAKKFLEIE